MCPNAYSSPETHVLTPRRFFSLRIPIPFLFPKDELRVGFQLVLGISYSFPVSPQFHLDSFTPVFSFHRTGPTVVSPHMLTAQMHGGGGRMDDSQCVTGAGPQVCPVRYWLLSPVGSWCASLCPMSKGLASESVFQDLVAIHSQNARMSVPGGNPETVEAHILHLQTGHPPREEKPLPKITEYLGGHYESPDPMPQPFPPCHVASLCHIDKLLSPSLLSLVFVFFLCLPHLKFTTHPDPVIP